MKERLVVTIIFAVGLLSGAPGYAWQPLPEPGDTDLIERRPLTDPSVVVLRPGESLEFEPDRLSYCVVQFRPVDSSPFLRLEQLSTGESAEASLIRRATLARAGEWQFVTTMSRTRMRLTLTAEAPEAARVAVASVEQVEPWMYWEWWQEVLHDWVDGGARGAPPAGLTISEQAAVLEQAQEAGLLIELVRSLGATRTQLEAARHLAHAILLRAVMQHREPQWRFYRRRDLRSYLSERPVTVSVDTGSSKQEAWKTADGVPVDAMVEGPAVVALGLRGVKAADRLDAQTRYRLQVTGQWGTVHEAEFSSRAAIWRGDETENADEEDDARYVEVGSDVVGWRRRTRFWIPPGRHRLRFEVRGADAYLDGEVFRPRTHVEDAVTGRENLARHVGRVEKELATDDSVIGRLLRMELAAYRLRADRAATMHRSVPDDDARHAVARGWLAWRQAAWLEPKGGELDRIEAVVDSEGIPERLRTATSWALLEAALEAERFGLATRLASNLDVTPGESAHRAALRAHARIRGTGDRVVRWDGFLTLWRQFLARPFDDDLRNELQQTWWHQTYWDGLEVEGGEVVLQPLGPPDRRIATRTLADRERLLYSLSDEDDFETWAPAAPDRPTRLRRLRVATFGPEDLGLHSVSVDGKPYTLVRREPLEFFDFAVAPSRAHRLRATTGVYATTPPDGAPEVPADKVFAPREAVLCPEGKDCSWSLPMNGVERMVRLNFSAVDGDFPEVVAIDDGVGEIRRVTLRRLRAGPTSEWLPVEFRVHAAATQISIRSDGGRVRAALDMRVPRPPAGADAPPLDIEVDLPADESRLQRIQEISGKLAERESAALRLERVRLLMSLDQDELARADAERLLSRDDLSVEVREEIERLHQALLIRLSYLWLEIGERWLGDRQSVPMDLGAEVVRGDDCGPNPLERAPADCEVIRTYLQAMSGPPLRRLNALRTLADRDGPHDWLFDVEFASAAVALVERKPRSAPPGLAAEAFGRVRAAMKVFPSRRNRSRYYGALRWTRWETVPSLSAGSFWARFEPPLPPVNADALALPTMNDPDEEAVEHAMLGVPWDPAALVPLYTFARRTLRYHIYWDGFLEVQTTCADLRPDLQPRGVEECEVNAALSSDGKPLSGTTEGSKAPGRVHLSRWRVSAGQDVKLTLHRADGVLGRAFRARPVLIRSGRDSRPPARRLQRRLDILPPSQEAYLDVRGPVVLRVDARGVIPGAASSIAVQVDDGPKESIDIPREREPEALMMEQPLTRSVRRILWLDEPRTYRVRLHGGTGFAAIRVGLRTDDYDALLSPDGAGWREPAETERDPGPFEPPGPRGDQLDLGVGSLVFDPPVRGSAIVEVEYRNRDRALLEDDELVLRRDGFLRALAGGYMQVGRAWLDARVGGRGLGRPAVAEAHADVYWRAPWRLRVEGGLSGYAQRIAGQTPIAGRVDAKLLRPVSLASDWLLLPRGRVIARFQPSEQIDPREAPIVFNGYAADHPLTYEEAVALWFRPFINAMAIGEVRLRHNTRGTFDQGQASVAARTVLESTEHELEYTARVLFDDDDRADTYLFHDLDWTSDLAFWVNREHLLALGLWGRLTVAPGTVAVLRPRFGLSVTYWFSERGLRDRPSSEMIYGDLLEPRYFND